jgi:hypothetical protein
MVEAIEEALVQAGVGGKGLEEPSVVIEKGGKNPEGDPAEDEKMSVVVVDLGAGLAKAVSIGDRETSWQEELAKLDPDFSATLAYAQG